MFHEDLACDRQARSATDAGEELSTHFPLELLDLAAQRRLGDVQTPCCTKEVLLFGDGDLRIGELELQHRGVSCLCGVACRSAVSAIGLPMHAPLTSVGAKSAFVCSISEYSVLYSPEQVIHAGSEQCDTRRVSS